MDETSKVRTPDVMRVVDWRLEGSTDIAERRQRRRGRWDTAGDRVVEVERRHGRMLGVELVGAARSRHAAFASWGDRHERAPATRCRRQWESYYWQTRKGRGISGRGCMSACMVRRKRRSAKCCGTAKRLRRGGGTGLKGDTLFRKSDKAVQTPEGRGW